MYPIVPALLSGQLTFDHTKTRMLWKLSGFFLLLYSKDGEMIPIRLTEERCVQLLAARGYDATLEEIAAEAGDGVGNEGAPHYR
ncbi:hypothetical protein [Paenibacillus sp. GCM10012304]|uniref:hypothetical protein n=1 Tax=Paenibacillus sp. GCM10012304 TaxID=3317341 RepID=UPI00360D5513